jgi:hypothetical protein
MGHALAKLARAARDGDAGAVATALVEKLQLVEARDWNEQTVWHIAAREGRLNVLKAIVLTLQQCPAAPAHMRVLLRHGHSTASIITCGPIALSLPVLSQPLL